MGFVFCFLVNSLFILLCSGIAYFISNLARVLAILEIKVLSFLFYTVLTLACLLLSILSDIRAGMVPDIRAGSELGTVRDRRGVKALLNSSGKVDEASESSKSKAQKVQFEIAR